MRVSKITKQLLQSFNIKNGTMNLHRWGNHNIPDSDCFKRMDSCMAMKWNDYHNVPTENKKISEEAKKTMKNNIVDVSDPNIVMMRMTMLF